MGLGFRTVWRKSRLLWVSSSIQKLLSERVFDSAREPVIKRHKIMLTAFCWGLNGPSFLGSRTYFPSSFDEMAQFDLEAMVDKALSVSGRDHLHYVGYSQVLFYRL